MVEHAKRSENWVHVDKEEVGGAIQRHSFAGRGLNDGHALYHKETEALGGHRN